MDNLQSTINYQFKDKSLLEQALRHSSYANEHHMPKLSDNERLEFLGDAVLELISSEFLYLNYSDIPEGELTKLRASLVCEPTLAIAAKEINLGDYIFLAKGEDKSGGRLRKSILSDALEAVIGAIFLDGGIEPAKDFVLRFILTDIEHKKLFHDSKTHLQEVVQANAGSTLEYNLVKSEGPDHAKVFYVDCIIDGQVVATGSGSSKKSAEQEAAYSALVKMKEEN